MVLSINLNPPLVLCFDIKPTDAFFRAVGGIMRKYPEAALATFDREAQEVAKEVHNIGVFHFSISPKDCTQRYEVLGVLCGSDRAFKTDRKVMRC